MIYNNNGFHRNILDDKIPRFLLPILYRGQNYSVPFTYKINKDDTSTRRLSLLHPSIQLELVDFYDQYKTRILSSCSKSKLSIRYPSKIASKFYFRKKGKFIKSLKDNTIMLSESEKDELYQSSFFAYEKFILINNFTSSRSFINLEQDYNTLLKIDVKSCFDSIYTHSICWAVKNKKFAKSNSTSDNFENLFDKLMQRSNFNETNGILTGPEICRIFSEIIFQKIDNLLIKRLKGNGLNLGVIFDIKRYVDDYFVFSNSIDIANLIEHEINDLLHEYKLHTNESKRVISERPFYTNKDVALEKVKVLTSNLNNKITKKEENEKFSIRTPSFSRINVEAIFLQYIKDVKSIAIQNGVKLISLTPYIINSIKNLSCDIIDKSQRRLIEINDDTLKYFHVLLELLMYFYSIDRRTSSSFNFCQTIILINNFFKLNNKENHDFFKDKISHFILNRIERSNIDYSENNKVELHNLIISLKSISNDYESTIPESKLITLLESSKYTYFDFITFMFILKDLDNYHQIKGLVIQKAMDLLSLNTDDLSSTEYTLLFLDFLSCQNINKTHKYTVIEQYLKNLELKDRCNNFKLSLPKTRAAKVELYEEIIIYCTTNNWFTNWKDVDLLKLLRKKELNHTY
jgi:hypothetical protein